MLEALEALECEREEKYELKKQLDQRMHFDCALGSLGLRFSSSSHSSDKYLKDSSNFTIHSVTSSSGKDEQLVVVDEKNEKKNERSRSSCISSSSFTYFDGKMNCIRNSFLNLNRSKRDTGDTNSRCMSSDVITSSLDSNNSFVSSTCILPNVSENSNKYSNTSLFEKNDKNFFNSDKYIDTIDKCHVNASTINESLFAGKLTCSSSLTSVTLTSGNSSGTPNSSLSVTPASTCCSSYINSPDSSPSLYSRSDSTSNSSTSPTAIVSTAPIVTSEIVEQSSSLSTSDQFTCQQESLTGEADSSVSKGVSCTSNTNSRHNSFESCESTIGNNDSSSTSSYYTCHSSSAVCTVDTTCPSDVDHHRQGHKIKLPDGNCNKVCHLPCREMSSSLSSDICEDNKSTDGKDNTVYVSVADATLIDTVDYIKADAGYFVHPSSNDNYDRKLKCLSNYVDTVDKTNCRNDDNLILECVSNGDSDDKMSNCISIDTKMKDICTSQYKSNLPDQCYSMSTSTSFLTNYQSLVGNNESMVNAGAINLSQVNEVTSTNDTSVNNYSPSINTNKCIVSSSPSAVSTDISVNDNTSIDERCLQQQQKQLEPQSHVVTYDNKKISLQDDSSSSSTETDVNVYHNIYRHNNTDSDNKRNVIQVQRPKSLMTEYTSHKSLTNELVDNFMNKSPNSLTHSNDYLGRVNGKSYTTGQVFNSKSCQVNQTTVPVIDSNYKATSIMQSTGNDKLATSSKYHHQQQQPHHTESISEVSKNMAKCFPSQVYATSLAAGAAFSSFSASPSTGTSCTTFNNLPSTKYSLRQSNSDYLLSNVYSSHSQVTCNLYPFSSEQLNSSYLNRKSNVIRSCSVANCKDAKSNYTNGYNDHASLSANEDVKLNKMINTKDNHRQLDDSFIDHSSLDSSSTCYLNHSSSLVNCIDINRKCAQNLRALTCFSRLNHHKTTLRRKCRLISHNRCRKSKLIHQFKWLSCSTLNRESYLTMAPRIKKNKKLPISHKRNDYKKNNHVSHGNNLFTRHGTGKLMKKRQKNFHHIVASEPDHLCTSDNENVNSRYASLDDTYRQHFFISNLNNSLDSEYGSLVSGSTTGSGNSSIDCNHERRHLSNCSSTNSLKVLNCENSKCNEIQYASIIPRSKRSKRSINDTDEIKSCLIECNKVEEIKNNSSRQLHMKSNLIEEKSVIHIDHTNDGSLFYDKRNTSQGETVTTTVNSSAKVLIHRSEENENVINDANDNNKSSVTCGLSKRLNRTNEIDNNYLSAAKSSTRNNISTGYDTHSSSKVKSKLPAIATIYSHDLDKIDRFDSVYTSNSAIDVSNSSVKLNKYLTLSDSFHDNLTNNADPDEEISALVDTGTIYQTVTPATEALLSTASRKNTDLCVSSQSTSRSNVCLAALKATVRALAGCFLGLFAP